MDDELREVLTQLIKDHIPKQTIPAEVVSVDENKATCMVKLIDDPDIEIPGVRLRSVNDQENKGFLIIPENDSPVLISQIQNSEQQYYVSVCSRIKKILVTNNEGRTFEISDKIKINGDGFGGLIKIDSIIGRLNPIETKLNQLIVDVAALAAPLGLTGALTSNKPPAITNTQKSQIENNKVVHG